MRETGEIYRSSDKVRPIRQNWSRANLYRKNWPVSDIPANPAASLNAALADCDLIRRSNSDDQANYATYRHEERAP